MRTRKQSGVRRILKVYKESARVAAVNTRSQNFTMNNKSLITAIERVQGVLPESSFKVSVPYE